MSSMQSLSPLIHLIHLIDDDAAVRDGLALLISTVGADLCRARSLHARV